MRLATTLILLALVIALAGFIKFYEQAKLSTDEFLSSSTSATRFDPATIRSIAFRGPTGKIALQLDDNGFWQIDEPYIDRADPIWVADLLAIAKNLDIVETITDSEIGDSVDLADTGLGDGRFEIEFNPENGDPIRLLVGGPSPLKGTTYVRREGDGMDIHVVSGSLHPLLSRPPSDLRDRHLFQVDSATLAGVSLKNPGGEIELERGGEDAFWMLTRPLQTRGHRNYVDDLLALLTNTEITGIASSGNGTESRAFEPGLTTTVTLKTGGENPRSVVLEVAQPTPAEPATSLARVSDRPHVFKVDSELLELLDRSPNDLRDDFLANIDPEAVSAISVTDLKGYRTMIRRRGDIWVLERNGTFEGANFKAIADFFKTLNGERVIDFASDSSANLAAYGLDRPYLRILLAGFESQPPAAVGAAASEGNPAPDSAPSAAEREIVDLRIGISREDGKLYANFVGEPFIYRIGDVILGAAPADPLKWKALNLLRFGYTDLKTIHVVRGTDPPTSITCNFNLQQFHAEAGGKDITPILDKSRVTDLALTLSGLRAANWVTDSPEEIPELKNPSLVLNLTIDHRLPGGGSEVFPVALSFAPTVPGRRTPYFYGKIHSGPEVFVIPYATYKSLAASPISDPARPRSPDDPDDGLAPFVAPQPAAPRPPSSPDIPSAPNIPNIPGTPDPAPDSPPAETGGTDIEVPSGDAPVPEIAPPSPPEPPPPSEEISPPSPVPPLPDTLR